MSSVSFAINTYELYYCDSCSIHFATESIDGCDTDGDLYCPSCGQQFTEFVDLCQLKPVTWVKPGEVK